ncbi:12011_t:CDS:2 [Diversispora eburnea]|uniref:12011_t:CDS:1 n=1 Tax=Diversispora eburnea TaxID=1213867 RepID=A0A9N8V5C5_9GLOM|nr:12011_t:CDS:2 [Diversispora eburnea]
MDWARTEFLMLQFPEAIRIPNFTIGLSGVSMYFKKEIPRFSAYKIQTKILTWNKKWIFLLHRFITESKNNNSDNTNIDVHSVGISKIVFKEKTKTLIPEQFFDEFGFKCETEELKIKREEIRKKGWKFIEGLFEFEKLIDYCEDEDRDYEEDYLENEKQLDTNLHLNNGSYNKHLDWARAEFLMLQFPEIIRIPNFTVGLSGISKVVIKKKTKTLIPEQFFDEFGFKCETEELKIKREEIRKKGWKFIEGLFEFEKLIDYCEDKDRDDEEDYLENEKVISKF